MKYELDLLIVGLPKMLTNGSQGWKGNYYDKLRWMDLVQIHVQSRHRPPEPLTKAHVVLTRCSSRAPDRDNLAASFKAVLDGLVECGVLIDDSPDVLVTQEYRWEKASPKDPHIKIHVEAA